MIAAADAAGPSSAITFWIAAAGVPVLLLLVGSQIAGRPWVSTRSAPFETQPSSLLVLLAFAAYAVGMAAVALIIDVDTTQLGALVGLATIFALVGVARFGVLGRVLRPQGSLLYRIALGLAVCWACLPVVYGLMLIVQLVSGVAPQSHVDTILNREEGWQWFVVLAVVVAPLLEEVTVRGLLYCGLRGIWGPRVAIIVSSILFGLMHVEPPQVWAPLAVFGVFLAYLVEVTGSLAAPIAAHMAFNALTVGQLLAA